MFKAKIYKNTTELANLNGVPIYMEDMVDAALRGRLNVFLQGNTGSGKTQLVRDAMQYFGDKSMFLLGRNDMDTRELFQRVNPEYVKAMREGRHTDAAFKDITERVNYHLIAVDELPNCHSAVRAQLFNLFDGFIEIDGKAYPIGSGYSVGMATGNIGQQFTESSNELGRALKDRMHLIIDTDYFMPQPIDTFDMLASDRNPRVAFEDGEDKTQEIIEAHRKLKERDVPFEKLITASYLVHGLDYLPDDYGGSKIGLKSGWPNKLEGHEAGSDEALILPVSPRAAKSIITLSQALDQIVEEGGVVDPDSFSSMMTAFKFASAYSGVLDQAQVRQKYNENPYKAMDAVIATTQEQFEAQKENVAAGIEMARKGKKSQKLLNEFQGRWKFMGNLLENLAEIKNEAPR